MKNYSGKTAFLIDLILIGPTLLYAATRKRELKSFEKAALIAIAVTAITYNYNRAKLENK